MSPSLNHSDVLTVPEVAKLLRLGPKQIRRMARLNTNPCRQIRKRKVLRFSRAALMAWPDRSVDAALAKVEKKGGAR